MIQKIKTQLCESFVNVQDIKMNVDLIRQICCTIENISSGQKVDKLELFMKIHQACFGQIDANDVETLKNIINYLNDNNKIKARSMLSKIYRFLKGWLVKK
jgi:hypothetical protein